MPRFSIGYAPPLRLGCPPPWQRELTVRCLGGPAHGGGPFICLKDTRARSESKPVNHAFWARELPDKQRRDGGRILLQYPLSVWKQRCYKATYCQTAPLPRTVRPCAVSSLDQTATNGVASETCGP